MPWRRAQPCSSSSLDTASQLIALRRSAMAPPGIPLADLTVTASHIRIQNRCPFLLMGEPNGNLDLANELSQARPTRALATALLRGPCRCASVRVRQKII